MALKADRYEFKTDITFFCNDVVTRGCILVFNATGSGVAMDQTVQIAAVPAANPSGQVPVGLLLNDMVNVDQTRYHINYLKDEMQKGSKCTLGQRGWWVTNYVQGTPSPGNDAFLGASGFITTTNSGAAATPKVGKFLSGKDEKGYAKVEILLP